MSDALQLVLGFGPGPVIGVLVLLAARARHRRGGVRRSSSQGYVRTTLPVALLAPSPALIAVVVLLTTPHDWNPDPPDWHLAVGVGLLAGLELASVALQWRALDDDDPNLRRRTVAASVVVRWSSVLALLGAAVVIEPSPRPSWGVSTDVGSIRQEGVARG